MSARHIYTGRDWTRPCASHSRRESHQFATWDHARRIINWREVIGAVALIAALITASIIAISLIHGGK